MHLEHQYISILITLLLMQARGARPSLYNVAKETGAGIATIYRRALELAKMGLLLKAGRGSYTVTPKGAFYLVAIAIRNDVYADDFGRTVQVLLPPKFGGVDIVEVVARYLSVPLEVAKRAERVIARAILEFSPSVK